MRIRLVVWRARYRNHFYRVQRTACYKWILYIHSGHETHIFKFRGVLRSLIYMVVSFMTHAVTCLLWIEEFVEKYIGRIPLSLKSPKLLYVLYGNVIQMESLTLLWYGIRPFNKALILSWILTRSLMKGGHCTTDCLGSL